MLENEHENGSLKELKRSLRNIGKSDVISCLGQAVIKYITEHYRTLQYSTAVSKLFHVS